MLRKAEMKKLLLSLLLIVVIALPFMGCSSSEDITGIVQAIDGKEVIVTLDDGSTLRLSADSAEKAAQAKDLLGEMVEVKFRPDKAELVKAERVGTNDSVSGIIESIGDGVFVIGGRTLKVNGNTRLDGGLAQGVLARAEFVKLADGSLVAKEIETDIEDNELAGKIEAISADSVKIAGKTFKVNGVTMLDDGLASGVMARVEFVKLADGTLEAIKVETDQDDTHFSGAIESIKGDTFTIGGKMLKVNAATRLDSGLVTGAIARVEFIKLADGSLLAKEIEVDKVEMERKSQQQEQELRGREQELQKREQELRGREAEGEANRSKEVEARDQEIEARGREAEARGRLAEAIAGGRLAEVEIRSKELEARGREVEARGQEVEARGKQAEAEVRGKQAEAETRGQEAEARSHEAEARGQEAEARGKQAEAEIRGRQAEAEIRGREAEARGREAEARGQEAEARGKQAEAEIRGGQAEAEVRGREAEVRGQEAEARGQEAEARGHEAEGEVGSGGGADDKGGASGGGGVEPGDDNGGASGGSGSSGSGSGGSGGGGSGSSGGG